MRCSRASLSVRTNLCATDEDSDAGTSGGKGASDFADFDDFAHLLEESGKHTVNPKQVRLMRFTSLDATEPLL